MSKKLLDELIYRNKLKNDAQLSKLINSSPASLCNLRAGRKNLSADLILKIYDKTGMSIEEIRKLAKED